MVYTMVYTMVYPRNVHQIIGFIDIHRVNDHPNGMGHPCHAQDFVLHASEHVISMDLHSRPSEAREELGMVFHQLGLSKNMGHS
jgi:hypothetical protein